MKQDEEKLIRKIEKINEEYLEDGNYALGVYIKYLYNLYKSKKFIQLFKMLKLHLKNKKKKNNIKEKVDSTRKNEKYIFHNKTDKKIAIYTCITGDYDNIEEPLIMEDACDYFLFTNNSKIKSDSWKIKDIPEKIKTLNNNIKINRYIKMHPKELFPDYDYAIYIDGNIEIISLFSREIDKINSKTGLAIHRHCQRECIYDEIKACNAYNKGNYKKLIKQARRYKKEGFPKKYGMLECNVLVSDLNNNNSKKIFDDWWNEYSNSESKRDQISLPYVLWKNNYTINDIGFLGNNVNKNKILKINTHR